MSEREVRVEVEVDASIERCFDVFTARFDTWWPHGHRLLDTQPELDAVVLEPRVGGRLYERTGGAECDWGRVLAWDPPKGVSFSWQLTPDFGPESDESRASRVDVSFTAEGDSRTRVVLVHSDFEKHGAGWEKMRDGVGGEGGWPGILRSYAETAGIT